MSNTIKNIGAIGTKTYHIGDKVDLSDIRVVIIFKDEKTKQIDINKCKVLPKVFKAQGQKVVISYKHKDNIFTCEVEGIEVI